MSAVLGALGGRWDMSIASLFLPLLPELAGIPVRVVEGTPLNLKVTTQIDLELAEWLVDRDEYDIPHRTQIMPWTRSNEEDIRARRSVLVALLIVLASTLFLVFGPF